MGPASQLLKNKTKKKKNHFYGSVLGNQKTAVEGSVFEEFLENRIIQKKHGEIDMSFYDPFYEGLK